VKRVLLVGAGTGGSALFEVFIETEQFRVCGIVDKNEQAPGIIKAKKMNIPVFSSWKEAYERLSPVDVVIEVTGDSSLLNELRNYLINDPATVIPSSVASIMFYLMEEKELLLDAVKEHNTIMDVILDSTHDGMIAIDLERRITLINRSAEKMSGLKRNDVLGKRIEEFMPTSKLPRVLKTGKTETNRRQVIGENRQIITTRVPMFQGSRLIGALGVFKDVTEIFHMAEEVTNLKSIRQMLEAIINSSDDAISVVDEEGKGLLINPAYTRLTGLDKKEVIGKPAYTDISEGESMHMRVLKTGNSVRGAKMKVGPNRKDVAVNVAPVIVDGKIKGSVGVIHDMSEIETLTDELEKAKQIIRTLEAKYTFDDIIGNSEELQVAIQQAMVAAATPATILLQGESGTGKELFAHAIHNASSRKFNKFIRVNCAAISETLLESELFGYEEGAFSGAKKGGKKGLFEEADRGSIFLDEIGEITPQIQAKLLRVLQEQEIVRVGGTKPVAIDVRVIAATNVNMEKRLESGEFRADLFYRLNRMPIYIPPLRSRAGDIPQLCDHLLLKLNQEYGRNVKGADKKAISMLQEYHWPGNVRELENIIGRAMIHMHYLEQSITAAHLPQLNSDKTKGGGDWTGDNFPAGSMRQEGQTLQEVLEATERQTIIEALLEHNSNKTKTAKALGLSLRSLYYKIDKLSINIEN
jgi:PAS domain S-box-containing protein